MDSSVLLPYCEKAAVGFPLDSLQHGWIRKANGTFSGKTIGRVLNPEVKLNNIEFPETWTDEAMRRPVCRFIEAILRSLESGERTLIHCDAGRDRTGSISALLAALAAETEGRLTPRMLGAIECDYRKTTSLVPDKYGRMARFVRHMQAEGGVSDFLRRHCDIDPKLISSGARALLYSGLNRTPQKDENRP